MTTSSLIGKTVCLAACIASLSACTSTQTQTYANNKPTLKIQDFFTGAIHANGIVLNRSGALTRSFAIQMQGEWHQQQGRLQEQIHYSDGESEHREWHFIFQDPNHFTASAFDAVGLAQGTQYGNAVHMTYILNVPVDNKTYAINFDDWLYMTRGGKVINRTTLSKFGISLGEVIITYDKK